MSSLQGLALRLVIGLHFLVSLSSAVPLSTGPTSNIFARRTPTLPSPGTDSTLPSTDGKRLVYVTVGRGIQNYTCADTNSIPVAIGAVATLFDGTNMACRNERLLHTIPPLAVDTPASGGTYTLPQPGSNLAVLGHHYFAADGTPTFDLHTARKVLYAEKNGSAKAPDSASKGPAGTGAVDWLSLVAKADYPGSVGLSQVYRIITAGGSPPATCSAAGVVTVEYAAEYWFYE